VRESRGPVARFRRAGSHKDRGTSSLVCPGRSLPWPVRSGAGKAVRRRQGGSHAWPRKTSAVSQAAPEPKRRSIFLSRSGPPPIPRPLRCGHTASASELLAPLLFYRTLLTTMAGSLRRQSAFFAVSASRQLASTLTPWTSVSPLLPHGFGRTPTASRTGLQASSPPCTAPPRRFHETALDVKVLLRVRY